MTEQLAAAEDAHRYLELLWQPGEVREVRLPRYNRYGHTASGYFSDPGAAAEASRAWDGRANVYVTLNPVAPALLARARERIIDRAEHATADEDVLRRAWLLLDVDSVRPSGISSTDVELAAAWGVTEAVTGFLASQGWPEPLIAMSGNGYHILHRIELANDPEASATVSGVLRALAGRFDSPAAHVDPSVSNAARISALVGTTKMKGDSLPDRPHRRVRLVRVPPVIIPVTIASLHHIAAADPRPDRRSAGGATGRGRLRDLLEAAGLAFRAQPPDRAGIVWYHVERCPFHVDGRNFECGVGEPTDGRLVGHCFHPEGQGKTWRDWRSALGLGPVDRASALTDDGLFRRTDAGNGEYFARLYGERVRYDHRRRRWLLWAGDWWRPDDAGAVRRMAKDAARGRYQGAVAISDLDERASEARFAIGSENRQRMDAMLRAAESEPPIADNGQHWDENPWLLGVANGVVDLRSGELRPGAPEDGITQHSRIAFNPHASCPRWEQFLDEIFCSDRELIDYIARAVGYSLSGNVSEQCVFLCHGGGANGKGVFLNTLAAAAGDYAFNAPFATFEQKDRASIPNDLAALSGRRLVTASETNEGTRLNESRMKALTGGDPITARFLHAEFFTFQPVGKFWLAANHKPRVTDDSFGFWRRVRLIPFLRQFKEDADLGLGDALRGELPGILAWAVRGAHAWQERGLVPPPAVAFATNAYQAESDPLRDFLDARCLEEDGFMVGGAEAYRAYKAWAADEGLAPKEILTNRTFGERMAERFHRQATNRGRIYQGVGLRSGADPSVKGQ